MDAYNRCFFLYIYISVSFFLSLKAHLSSAADTISLGHSLSGDQTLVSKGGSFELGFFTPGKSRNHYIGIWYKNIPTKDIIWVANRGKPVSNRSASELKISKDGNLVLLNELKVQVWSSNSTPSSSNATIAKLLDTGNLVIGRNASNSSSTWQSFDYPTDTWVPQAWVGMNKITGEYQSLISWKNSEDPSPGLYTFGLDPDGSNQNVALYNGSQIYTSSGVWNGRFFSARPGTETDPKLNVTFVDNKDRKYTTYNARVPSILFRYVVDSSGQTKFLLWTNNTKGWVVFFSQPESSCDVYNFCGAYSVCDQKSSSFCSCFEGFEPASKLDSASGCARRTGLFCSNGGEQDKFLKMQKVSLPSNPYLLSVGSNEECELACLNDCSCTAYAFETNCSIWQGDLKNVQLRYDGVTDANIFYLRLAASDLPVSRKCYESHKLVTIVFSTAVVGVLLLSGIVWGYRRNGRRLLANLQDDGSLIYFSYSNLLRMTKNFSEKVGNGGFGSVFKGTMVNSMIIAVKKLEGLGQGDKQFRTEVRTLSSIQHVNIVRLLGFCCEGSNRLLVYEYMSGGSLDCHLSANSTSRVLSWSTRYQIILGIARGIAYLHEECRERVIHCDIKPENILLDPGFRPKVADFGMSKLIGRDFSRVLTTMKGTIGYLAPEWIHGLPITPKVDVYSFGMMLFEIVSGRRNSIYEGDRGRSFFPSWAATQLERGDTKSLLDQRLEDEVDMEELERVCRVAGWCIQDSVIDRPSMGQVVEILEGVVAVNLPPIPMFLQNLLEDEFVCILSHTSANVESSA